MYKPIDGVLRLYVEALIVNCQGRPGARGNSFPDFGAVLEWFYDSQMDDVKLGPDPELVFFWEIDPGGSNDA